MVKYLKIRRRQLSVMSARLIIDDSTYATSSRHNTDRLAQST